MKSLTFRFTTLLIVLFLNTDAKFSQFNIKCPSCNMNMFWSGETKSEWGKMFKLYECSADHSYWMPWETKKSNDLFDYGSSNKQNKSSNLSPTCPVCDLNVYWTGKTRTEWGKMQKIYKCPANHISVGPF